MSKGFAQKAVIGPQNTLHTAAATPPVIMRHTVEMIQDTREIMVPDEINGYMIPTIDRSYTPAIGATWAMPDGPANYEENLPIILNSAIDDQNTGTADGAASSGYLRTYDISNTTNLSEHTPAYHTVQTGDEVEVLEMEDGFVTDFSIGFVNNQAVTVASNWAGRQATIGSFYASAAVTAGPEDILANKGTLEIGDSTGAFGSLTSKTSSLVSGTLSVNTGWRWRTTLDGQLYPTDVIWDQGSFSAELQLVYIHNANAVTELAAWRAGTLRMVEINFTGSAYTTPGTGTTFSGVKGLGIQAVGKYTSFDKVDRDNGSSIVSATLRIGWSIADTHSLTILLANEDSETAAAS